LKKLIALLLGFVLPGTPLAGPTVEVIASNLIVPWAIALAPDGRIFITERPGRLRVVNADGQLQVDPVITIDDVRAIGEGGLLGLDIDPDFASNGYLYVYYTYGSPIRNKIVRLIESGGSAVIDQILLENIPGSSVHDGGRLKFGPDLKLYATAGDATCNQAQDDYSLGGKLLRLNSDGSVPDDNPFPDREYPASLVLSKGHRNPQGIAWDSSGQLYETEHGPTGDCGYSGSSYDEVNIIFPGGNYGWPCCRGVVCRPNCGTPPFIDPIRYWRPASEGGEGTAAPAGAAFLNEWFYFGTLGANFTPPPLYARHLHGILFDMPGGTEIIDERILFFTLYGRIRDVVTEAPPGQYLYFTNSNRDGRIEPELIDPADDRVFRVSF